MLLNYTFSNFRSFQEEAELTMLANSQRTLNSNLIRWEDKRVLPSAVIYGANASGKSNIIQSLQIMQRIVQEGRISVQEQGLSDLELYPFVYATEQKDIEFSVQFTHGQSIYQYGFALSVDPFGDKEKRAITKEDFTLLRGQKNVSIFHRSVDHVEMSEDKEILKLLDCDRKLIAELEKRINQNLDTVHLFLSNAFQSIVSKKVADIVLDFFNSQLMVVTNFPQMHTDLYFSYDQFPQDNLAVRNTIIDALMQKVDFGKQKIVFVPKKTGNEHQAKMELVSLYEMDGEELQIPASKMESAGTLKLLDFLIPFTEMFASGGVFVLDEFDSSIHPELVKGIIALFNDPSINKANAQLIFTTHNPIYLNNQIFRRDQIQFVEKDPETYNSYLYSLADFGSADVRNDENYLINYFKGKYGALPSADFASYMQNITRS